MASIDVRMRSHDDASRPGSIRVARGPAGVTVVLAGEIDASLCERAAGVARRLAGGERPLVDCSGVTLFCAAGVAILADLGAVGPGGAVRLAGQVPGVVRDVLDACGLSLGARADTGSVR